MQDPISRRSFTKASFAAAATGLAGAARAQSTPSPSEKIRLGFIGVGNRGGQLIDAFLEHDDMEIVAICDVYEPYLAQQKERIGGNVETHKDFRKIIDHPGIDAVVIATPDHWHAIQTIDACNAGKDVYVEKPLSITIHEGRKMVEAARRNNRIVQVGTHRRSSPLYHRLHEVVSSGTVGHVSVGRSYRLSNMYPNGIGKLPMSDPPKDLDWDLWLGPRPARPYQDNIAPYKFRWWHLYSSQMGNWGVHYLDASRWMTGDLAPSSICAMGGRFVIDDDRTIPDTMEAVFQLPSGRLFIFGQYEASGNPALRAGEVELRGTQGTVYVSGNKYEIFPERGGQFHDRDWRMEKMEDSDAGSNAQLTAHHARNFLDCVRSRELPNADVEIGHRSTTFSLLANISLATGIRLEWDAEKEQITNSKEANDLLHYEYRGDWKLS
ncbi:MAG: Gfo/Idh/MocA family oxidoreductase [Candidatus Hydrogenedentes bacterium]|nr:Gfo/Idh/MocA family oxidoreductase [Candidatus Hydrogenedentota bacterium]